MKKSSLVQGSKINRRSFIKNGIGSLALISITKFSLNGQGEQPASTLSKPVIYYALKWGMIREELGIEDKFKMLKDIGYDGVHIDDPFNVDPIQARRAAEKTGIIIHGVVDPTHWQIRLSDPNPTVRERALNDLIRCIRLAYEFGGSDVLLVPGHGQDGTQEEVASRAIEQIQKALPIAAKLGIRILIENVWNSFLYIHDGPANQTAEQLAAFVDRINSPWVGVFFDVGNHRKYGVPSQWIKQLGNRIVKLDIKDYDTRTDRWVDIGEGTVDWENVKEALAQINFHGWATAEVGGGDRKRLVRILEQMKRVLG